MWNFPFALFSWIQKDTHTLAWISLVSLRISIQTNEHIFKQQRVYKSSVFWKMFERYCGFFHLQKPYCYFLFHICYWFEWLPNNSVKKGAKIFLLIILKYLLPLLLSKKIFNTKNSTYVVSCEHIFRLLTTNLQFRGTYFVKIQCNRS